MLSEVFMERAIELAKLGKGKVNPNPLVGAVIVKNGKIIGEGYHHNYGNLHAETDAIKDCIEKGNNPENAIIYVTLEPCCHFGKQPPCTQAIVENKISEVVIGSSDPNPLVAGKGIKFLKNHNIKVTEAFLKSECDRLNPVFFHFIKNKTPYITLKYAQTADGKIATKSGDSKWISCEDSRKIVHQLRSENMGILVGVNTVLKDNPMLNVREVDGKNPVRIILDSTLKTPLNCNLVLSAKEIRTIIFTCSQNSDCISKYEAYGIEVYKVSSVDNVVDINAVVKKIGQLGIDSVLVEGGAKINASFIKNKLVNKIIVFTCPKILGTSGITACEDNQILEMKDAINLSLENVQKIQQDVMLEYKVEEI